LAGLLAEVVLNRSAVAQVTNQEAKLQVEETYVVEVLGRRDSEIDGRAVWLVTFVVLSCDTNSAFMVSSLAIDRESGDLVPAFRHRASGYELPGGLRRDRVGLRPDAMRTGTWR
jgi:hypothetical protein